MAEMARKKSLPAATRRPECSVLTKPLKVIAYSTPRDNYSENYSSSFSPLDMMPMYSPVNDRQVDFEVHTDIDNREDNVNVVEGMAAALIDKCTSILSSKEFPPIGELVPFNFSSNSVISSPDEDEMEININQEKTGNEEIFDEISPAVNPVKDATFVISNSARPSDSKNHPLLSPCSCKMRNCVENVTEDRRKLIHRDFWRMNYTERKQWIYNHVEETEPDRRYVKEPVSDEYKRNLSRNFFLPNGVSNVQVCRVMFIRTLGYTTAKAVDVAMKNAIMDNVSSDKRGKHAPAHKMKDRDEQFIVDHVFKFNPAIAHYRREHAPKRLYLPSELTIVEMYRDYVQECEEENMKAYSYSVYQKKVKSFNISFAKLGEEQCEDCDEHLQHLKESNNLENQRTEANHEGENNEVEDEISGDKRKRNSLKKIAKRSKRKTDPVDKNKKCQDANCISCANFDIHQKQYTAARKEYEKDKLYAEKQCDRTEMLISVDMQKVILLPRLEQFKRCIFTRRIVTINQSFVPIGTQTNVKPRGILWHEETCGRKDEDVTSAFLKEFTLLENRDVKRWTVWVDNCSGQNKCWTLFTMLVHLVNMPTTKIETIQLKYFTNWSHIHEC